ncbi:4'-phosphopantetheinyl transferase superfamily protein [Verrucomicrobium sp. BvORR106]|uniref:4'-phosphopantetheinyl transferase family protein n=1 Tax=Verrucomicrobium sp. BvORR106 TaxID=1403819 RepID=UPI00068E6C6A|nr:4'-phosphopantetheinyl transferase superfamily protein [Verrucomicrobium sp. BvORR106]
MDDALLLRLNLQLAALLPAGAVGQIDRIQAADDASLTPLELVGRERAVPAVKRSSGAARRLAKALCAQLGSPAAEIPRGPKGMPLWPPGVLGSMAHDDSLAVAVAAATNGTCSGLGVDIEPAVPLDDGLLPMIASQREQAAIQAGQSTGKLLFCIKEAVFKAVYPTDRVFLEFTEVEIDFRQQTALTNYGRTVFWRAFAEPHHVATAWW